MTTPDLIQRLRAYVESEHYVHAESLCAEAADELERLRAQQVPTVEDINAQQWAGMDGTTAFLLIERHAEGWAHCGRLMEAWRAANAAQVAPAGWKLVPVEPTQTMKLAPSKDRPGFSPYVAHDIWAAMLAAAPAAPAQQADQAQAVTVADETAWTFKGKPEDVHPNAFPSTTRCKTCGSTWGRHKGALCPAEDGRTFQPARGF